MNRRKFLKNSSALSAAPLVLNKVPLSPFATPKMMESFNCDTSDRALVVIFMMGGNDGLNTIVPIDQYSKYRNYRPTIYIPDSGSNKYITLDTTLDANQQTGLHPNMTAFKAMYDNGLAHIVQNVGYPSANKSHFKSTDLWLSGGDGHGANAGIKSGHFGRFLDNLFPNLVGNPSSSNPDPLGLQLGNSTVSLGYLTSTNEVASANLTDQDPNGLYSVVQDIGTLAHQSTPNNEYGTELDYIMNVERNTSIYAQRVSSVFQSGSNSSVSYPDEYLGYQLKTVARLLKGGSKTKVFLLHTYGFDTHEGQIQTVGNPTVGWHADNMSTVFNSIKAFHDDLNNLGIQDRVLTATMSEFGRKVIENGGLGTDHGTLAPMFLFGTPVAGGMTGTNMNLDDQDNQGAPNNSQLQYDYRRVFSSLYQDWLGANDAILTSTFGSVYSKIPVVNSEFAVSPSCLGQVVPIELFTFKARKVDERVAEIKWVTLSEVDHSHYIVERSTDGVNFDILTRKKGIGGPETRAEYEVYDTEPAIGVNYYRMKSVDLNGEFTYSQIESVTFREQTVKSLLAFPNPASIEAFVAINAKKDVNAKMQVYDMEGHELLRSSLNIKKGYHKQALNISELSSGIYMIMISDQGGEIASTKLVVAK